MASIGIISLGGRNSEKGDFPSGIALHLTTASKIDYLWESKDRLWQVQLAKDHELAVARSRERYSLDSLLAAGLSEIQKCLDIVAVKKLDIMVLDHPEINHIALFQRNEETVIQHFSMITFPIAIKVLVEDRDKDGNVKPAGPEAALPWTWAFRYYRLSQASHDVFEAYRNLFLSFEALLNGIHPKQQSEQEKKWLRNALSEISGKIDFSHFTPLGVKDPVAYLLENQYERIRCRLFHAKFPDALLPQEEPSLADVTVAYGDLLRLWRKTAEVFYQVTSPGGFLTNYSFKMMMDKEFGGRLSLQFTEDNSVPGDDDTQVNPRGSRAYEFEKTEYLSETKPGIVSWQGEIKVRDSHNDLFIHRICSLINNTLRSVDFIRNGLSILGVDVFQTYQSMRLLNTEYPKTTF